MLQLFTRVMSSHSMSTLIALTVAAGIALVFFMIFDALRAQLLTRLGNRIEADIGPLVLGSVVNDAGQGHDTQSVRDLHDVRAFVMSPAFTALLDAPWSVLFLAVIFMFHPVLGLVATVGLAILFGLGVLSELTGRKPAKAASATVRKSNATADEVLRNSEIVRAMGRTSILIARWQRQSFAAIATGTRAHDRMSRMSSLAKMVRMALQIAVMAAGVWLVMRGELAPGMMIAASILLGRAAAPVEQSIAGWRGLISVRLAVQRLNQVLSQTRVRQAKMDLPAPTGRLSVQDATVVSPARQDPLIFGVTFDLRPGDSLGLFGPSGAGKTTFVRALVGLQPLTRGFIRIDDAALEDWPEEQIGRHIGFLPQRVDLFDGTIAENIALMDSAAKPSDIVRAARRARVHELILSLPGGYNAQVGQNGDRLSAGQRQRIGLARAFFGDPCLIVLDEPNANLDPDGEDALADAISAASEEGAVVIVVSHRMSVLKAVNHIGVLEAGRMVRFGKAKAIVEKDNVLPMTGRVSPDDGRPKVAPLKPGKPVALQETAEGGAA
jgi:PrtD family type I secretion system ABC transporter